MREPIRHDAVPWVIVVAVAMLLLTACNPEDAATWFRVLPEETQAGDETAVAGAACERDAALARLRAAVPFETAVLYYTGRPGTEGDVVYSLTLWYVDPDIPQQAGVESAELAVANTVDRASLIVRDLLAGEACAPDLFDVLLLSVVDTAYNSWYLGNVPIADVVAGAGAEPLLATPDILLRDTWPEDIGALNPGSCSWEQATQEMAACSQSNGGCLLALTEQMGSVALMQSTLPLPASEWRADRDEDMAIADQAVAGIGCLDPRPYSMVMNLVDADGTLLFAGEWSGTASQVTYFATADTGG